MRVAIVGGKLQGVEASYLALSLGWKVLLIDRDSNTPAQGLCHSFHQCDVIRKSAELKKSLKEVDLIVPATENVSALRYLRECAESMDVPFAFDEKAYFLSRSKLRSNHFFGRIGIPTPRSWPQCGLPVMVKPSTSSGSHGVRKLSTQKEMADFLGTFQSKSHPWVIQEYLEGPSYSLEVFGKENCYEVIQVTELEMDDQYDCKRVLAPSGISDSLEKQFKQIGIAIARNLRLTGIMDVEVILHDGKLKVLEIDARLPSQTPTAVLKSTGINMLDLLRKIFVENSLPSITDPKEIKGVVYEHLRVSEKTVEVLGENILRDSGPLRVVDNFFGADVAITDFNPSRSSWVSTLIVTAENRKQAWLKRCHVIDRILKHVGKASSQKMC